MTNKKSNKLVAIIRDNLATLLILLLVFASRSSLADWYHVPTGSMQPTIAIGDRILVNKLAYRLELPFTDIPLMSTGTPERGDIVIFNSKVADTRLVKRLIGLPGDRVSMKDNRLTINGELLPYHHNQGEVFEEMGKSSHQLSFIDTTNALDSFGPVVVPKGHYLVLGDNRNNSADSRFIGFVSEAELQGKAIKVLLSLDPENYYLPRLKRSFSELI